MTNEDKSFTIMGRDISDPNVAQEVIRIYEEQRRQKAEKAKAQQTQPQVQAPIPLEGKIDSVYIAKPFDEAKLELETNGYRIISLEENAALRIQEGKDADSSQNGNWTREGIIYIPNQGVYLTKNSPILEESEKATQCHRDNKEFYLTEKQVEKALKNVVKIDKKSIPTDNFKNELITQFAFGKYAEEYGKFLKDAGITEMTIELVSMQDKPFIRQMWFFWLGYGGRSGLSGYIRYLYFDYRVRGVK